LLFIVSPFRRWCLPSAGSEHEHRPQHRDLGPAADRPL